MPNFKPILKRLENHAENYFQSQAIDRVLKRLEPYKPSKLILGSYFLKDSMRATHIKGGRLVITDILTYKGIPIEISENEYELDFEM